MKNRLKEFREEAGLTQEQLSIQANVSRTIISKLENGKSAQIKTNTLIGLSRALRKPVEEIFLFQTFNKVNEE